MTFALEPIKPPSPEMEKAGASTPDKKIAVNSCCGPCCKDPVKTVLYASFCTCCIAELGALSYAYAYGQWLLGSSSFLGLGASGTGCAVTYKSFSIGNILQSADNLKSAAAGVVEVSEKEAKAIEALKESLAKTEEANKALNSTIEQQLKQIVDLTAKDQAIQLSNAALTKQIGELEQKFKGTNVSLETLTTSLSALEKMKSFSDSAEMQKQIESIEKSQTAADGIGKDLLARITTVMMNVKTNVEQLSQAKIGLEKQIEELSHLTNKRAIIDKEQDANFKEKQDKLEAAHKLFEAVAIKREQQIKELSEQVGRLKPLLDAQKLAADLKKAH